MKLENAIIESMVQGCAIFDSDQRLVHYNQKFIDLFNFPQDFVRPGLTFEKISRFRAERGDYGEGDIEAHVRDHVNRRSAEPSNTTQKRTLPNGIVIVRHRQLMSDGSTVVTYLNITEIERTERALQQSENRFQAAFENSGVGMGIRNLHDGSFVTNEALQKMLGYSGEELERMHLRDIMDSEESADHKSNREKLRSGEIPRHQNIIRYLRKDGKPVWLLNNRSVVLDEAGKPLLLINLHQDVTEGKLAEQEAAKKSELLETTLANIAQGLCVYDGNQKLVAFNEQYVERAGFPPDFIHLGIDRREVLRFLAKEHNYGNGNTDAWVEQRISSLEAEDGMPIFRPGPNEKMYIFTRKLMPDGGFVGTYTDITDLKRAEREASKKSALLETTLENMGHAFVVFDADRKLAAFNQKYVDLYDFPPGFIRIGLDHATLMRHNIEKRLIADTEDDTEQSVQRRVESAKRGDTRTRESTLPDGTHYVYSRMPMPDGGFVATFTDITERKRIEQALRDSEERFRSAFDNSGVGVMIRSHSDRTVTVNDAFKTMSGYSQEELSNLHLDDITHPDDREENKTARQNFLDGKINNVQVTKRLIAKSGEHVWVINDMSVVKDAKGQIAHTINLFQNVTDRKLVEQKAEAQSRLLGATFENMVQGIAVFDSDHTLVAFNPQYAEILELPLHFLHVGLNRGDIFRYRIQLGQLGDVDIEAMIEERLADTKEATSKERTLPGGRTYSYELTPTPDGGYIITLTDITRRKRAERELTEQSDLLEATFENMAQGIAVFDGEHTLVAFNPQYVELVGLPVGFLHRGMNRAEILRLRWEQGRYGGAELEAVVAERLAKTSMIESGERTRANGQSYAYQRTPMPGGGYILAVTDITDRKHAEEQLQQAQKMEAVGQLTGGIAHDFNNLLAVSMGNIELAQDAARRGSDVGPFLSTIMRASERGAALTSQLLAFSRKQTLFPEVVNARELIGGMTNLLRSSLGETIEIKVTGDDDLWPCKVDPHQLESAVLNLAINARDAMPSGGLLTIETTNISLDDDYAAAQTDMKPGEYVMVAVTDTGSGMSKDVISQVFDPFFTTKEVGQGSGLGLSMVYGFVKQSGGHVTVYSEVGEGTTIKLYLPRTDKAEEQSRPADQADVPQAHGETVLVVEDDPEVRILAVALLSSFGYEIVEAADGKTALKALETAPRVNLLFTDVVLPGGMSGPELATEVRSRFPGIAILYTSGYTDLTNVDQSAFGEDTELLQKPYRKVDLARKVRLVLDQSQL